MDDPDSRNTSTRPHMILPARNEIPPPRGEGAPPSTIDVRERGAEKDGNPQLLDRRLFMQLLVMRCDRSADPAAIGASLVRELGSRGASAVVYEDVNDPRGLGLLTWTDRPEDFVSTVRP